MSHWPFTRGLHDLGNGCFAYLQPDGTWGWSNAGLVTSGGQTLLIDTERRWFPSHAHRTPLGFPPGIDPHSNARSAPQAPADGLNALNLPERFHMDFTNGVREHQCEFSVSLARPSK